MTASADRHPAGAAPRLVVVTGASQGIGAAVAEAFAARWGGGARLALVARSADHLETVAAACRARSADARAFPCDVTEDAAVGVMAGRVLAWGGAPAVLVCNAGAFVPGGFFETTPDAFRAQLEVNLTSAFLVARALVPPMLAARAGRVLFMGSVASVQGYPRGAAYGAAKHGLLGLARALRAETRGSGVGVTALLPGATRTPSWDGAGVPDERLMPAEDIARLCVDVAETSPRTVVEELLVRPAEGDL